MIAMAIEIYAALAFLCLVISLEDLVPAVKNRGTRDILFCSAFVLGIPVIITPLMMLLTWKLAHIL